MNYLMTVACEAAWTPANLFTTETGFILDGSPGASAFYEEDTRVTLATDNGTDPVGSITDTSRNANHAIQGTSANRPVFYVDANGVRSWRHGSISAVNRWLAPTTTVNVSSAMTVVSVYKYISETTGNGAALVAAFNGSWGAGGFFTLRHVAATPDNDLQTMCNDPATPLVLDGATAGGAGAIAEWVRTGTGANATTATTYSLAGAQIATITGTQNANPTNPIFVGYGDATLNSGVVQLAFLLIINRALSAAEQSSLRTYLTNKFGAW